MKMSKKKVFVVALALCLMAIVSVGSLAWFNAQASVNNQFHIMDSENDTPSKLFSVDVYEYTEDSPTEKVRGTATYNGVLPGDTLVKAPHVANTGYLDQYIRVVVTISDAAVWADMLGESFNDAALLACFGGFEQTMWTDISTEVVDTSDEIRIVMYYNSILAGRESANDTTASPVSDITVFTSVNIPGSMELSHVGAFGADGFSIAVKAQAVQTKNVTPNGGGAYEAFDFVNMAI